MFRKTLSEWLEWQDSLNRNEIELGLDRVREVARRLKLKPPQGRVFTVGGTNGKGSCAHAIEALLRANDLHTGMYTSPHLVRYNERICIDGEPVSDAELVGAFEKVESARRGEPLTYFEFGTLVALQIFKTNQCDAWVLEVGLGGRLDAVNIIDPDIALITTVDLDHEEWLGGTVEEIAKEKAGIMRAGKPALYGDYDVPENIRAGAAETGAVLLCLGEDYQISEADNQWSWSGREQTIDGLARPQGAAAIQIRNQGLVLAALEACDPALLANHELVRSVLTTLVLPGRMQIYHDRREWILDVAHNPQAARTLSESLAHMDHTETWVVLGMMADKAIPDFGKALDKRMAGWIACDVEAGRGSTAAATAKRLRKVVKQPVEMAPSVIDALELASERCPEGGRVVVCGSFHVVGPALEWLGLY